MKSYSKADLLGREVQLSNIKSSLIHWFESWIDRQSTEVELAVTIPHTLYLRTRLICDYIHTVYETPMDTSQFLNILYVDFIQRYMKKHSIKKMYEELTQYDLEADAIEINNPGANEVQIFKKKYQSNITINYTISKRNVKRGEMFLLELDELTGKHFTVEMLLSTLWINYIQGFSDGNNERAVDKIIKMAAKNF